MKNLIVISVSFISILSGCMSDGTGIIKNAYIIREDSCITLAHGIGDKERISELLAAIDSGAFSFESSTRYLKLKFSQIPLDSKIELIKYSTDSSYAQVWSSFPIPPEKKRYGIETKLLIPAVFLHNESFSEKGLSKCNDEKY